MNHLINLVNNIFIFFCSKQSQYHQSHNIMCGFFDKLKETINDEGYCNRKCTDFGITQI